MTERVSDERLGWITTHEAVPGGIPRTESRQIARELQQARKEISELKALWGLCQKLGIYQDVNGAIYNKSLAEEQLRGGESVRSYSALRESHADLMRALEQVMAQAGGILVEIPWGPSRQIHSYF